MRVLIIGAHGQIGTQLVDKLLASPHQPVAMVRREEQLSPFKEKGADAVLADLEKEIGHAFNDIDAVVFTAGSGGDTGEEMTDLVDRQGAIKAINRTVSHGIRRFVMVSAFGANLDQEKWPDGMTHYYEAKSEADEYLRDTNLDYTILMPGRLTDEPGTGRIALAPRTEERDGSISREDVAATILHVLEQPNTYRGSYELLAGDTPIKAAIRQVQVIPAAP